MPEPFLPSESFYGQQKPIRFEADVFECEVIGEIPKEINGTLYRLGPDRLFPTLEGDVIINGDGIVSAFTIENGHADYKCRYVKTERLLKEKEARKRLYGIYRNPVTDDPSTIGTDRDNTANTYAFYFGGRLFALREDSYPYEIDPITLETKEKFNYFGKTNALTMSAHPKIDPITKEWWSFSLFSKKEFNGEMMLQVADKDCNLIREEEFTAPFPGLSHDFSVTREHVIFPIMPLIVSKERLAKGGDIYAYDPNTPAAFGIMPRNGTTKDIKWFRIPNVYLGHTMNAYTEGNKVIMDATISKGNGFRFFKDINGNSTDPADGIATLTRIIFDLENDSYEVKPFAGVIGEMPKCDDRYQMSKYRYGFGKTPGGIYSIDLETGVRKVHVTENAPAGGQEPIFVPKHPNSPEGEGFLLCLVNNIQPTNHAELVVLDAQNVDGERLATIKLPFNQPMAFHGCFVSK